MYFYNHWSIPVCLENHSSSMKMAYGLLRLERELGIHGFRSPFAVTIRVQQISDSKAACCLLGARRRAPWQHKCALGLCCLGRVASVAEDGTATWAGTTFHVDWGGDGLESPAEEADIRIPSETQKTPHNRNVTLIQPPPNLPLATSHQCHMTSDFLFWSQSCWPSPGVSASRI